MKKTKQKTGCMQWKYGNRKTTGCPTKTLGHDRCGSGFTLVELVIVIAIVIILSVVSVPIYRGYVDKAKWSEAYALFGTLLSAQKAYYSEHGNFLNKDFSDYWTRNSVALGVDASSNKFFSIFIYRGGKEGCWLRLRIPQDLRTDNKDCLDLSYNISTGSSIYKYKE